MQVTDLPNLDDDATMVWINRYRPGDQVPTHCDRDGDTQLLLCLQQVIPAGAGGDTCIQGKPIPLGAGDALLFAANRLPHNMTRINEYVSCPTGWARVTCAMRFFAKLAE
jgi:hypothetical protein